MRATLVGDFAGGSIPATSQSLVTVNGRLWVVVGASVTPHGGSFHAIATLQVGVPAITIDGVPVVVEGLPATCGHLTTATDPLIQVNP